MCCIEYQACNEDLSFTIDVKTDPAATSMARVDTLCEQDYIMIGGEICKRKIQGGQFLMLSFRVYK